MKKKSQKLYIGIMTAAALVVTSFTAFNYPMNQAQAQCTSGDLNGNLFGYATMSNLSEPYNRIYMSTDSWNDFEPTETTVNFGVSYDRIGEKWDGKGWSPEIGWVDFGGEDPSLSDLRQARFTEIPILQSGQIDKWGGWNPIIDLANVFYSSDPGGFVNSGTNGFIPDEYNTGDNNTTLDTPVGVSFVDFSKVTLQQQSLGCNEFVNLLVNDVSSYYQPNCPIPNPTLSWATENTLAGSDVCRVVNSSSVNGVWNNPESPRSDSGSEEGVNVPEGMSPSYYRIECKSSSVPGQYIQSNVVKAACGEQPPCNPGDPGCPDPVDPCDPATDPNCNSIGTITIPTFIEV